MWVCVECSGNVVICFVIGEWPRMVVEKTLSFVMCDWGVCFSFIIMIVHK